MKKYNQFEKERIFAKYNVTESSCEKCGERPAYFRFFAGKTLCKSCAYVSFLIHIATLSAITVILTLIIF